MKYLLFLTFITLGMSSSAQVVNNEFKTPTQKQLDSLKTKLETLFRKDQVFRKIYVEAENKLGKDSMEMDYFWEVVEAQDKALEKELISIIDTYGWLGISQVGRLANTAQWAILQHGSVTSKEKYAPFLKASVLKNESQAMQYARLIDRMLINSSKSQLYGTQYEYNKDNDPVLFEIKNPEYIDKRREEIGLSSMQEFTKKIGVEWGILQKN